MKRDATHWMTLPAAVLLLWWIGQTVLVASPASAAEPGDENRSRSAKVTLLDSAAKRDDEDQPRTLKLTVYPAAEPVPALKYELLPNLLDRKPGNAAVLYNKLALQLAENPRKESWEKIYEWLPLGPPLTEFPLDEVRQALSQYQQDLDDIDLAARRDHCDWQLPIREREMMSLLLPELQVTRQMARLLALQTRLQIAEGRHDDAIHTLQTGYALGGHVGQAPTFVGSLIGTAITSVMSQELGNLIQQPEAPNLYWAISGLPRPPVSMNPGSESERFMLYLSFPELLEVHEAEGTPEYWQKLLDDTFGRVLIRWTDTGLNSDKLMGRLVLTGMAWRGYPMARQHLIDAGRSPDEVDKMPIPQVVSIYTVDTFNEYRDDMFKWFNLPYYEASKGLKRARERFRREAGHREIIPLASRLLPAVSAAKFAEASIEREIAMLRIVEAIRIYGAAHEGRLPKKLDDVTEVPIPFDPVTGKPFGYKLDGDTATLDGYSPSGRPVKIYGRRFEITLAQP